MFVPDLQRQQLGCFRLNLAGVKSLLRGAPDSVFPNPTGAGFVTSLVTVTHLRGLNQLFM